MFRKVDCVLLRVPDLGPALEFYRDRLGLPLAWRRGATAAGLKMRDSESELVLLVEPGDQEVDLLVDSADAAAQTFQEAGGTIVRAAFDIPIGRCAVVKDPWGSNLVLLDMSKGPLRTDSAGNVLE